MSKGKWLKMTTSLYYILTSVIQFLSVKNLVCSTMSSRHSSNIISSNETKELLFLIALGMGLKPLSCQFTVQIPGG